jgi:hypothetical protein
MNRDQITIERSVEDVMRGPDVDRPPAVAGAKSSVPVGRTTKSKRGGASLAEPEDARERRLRRAGHVLDPRLQEELLRYPKRWVAITYSRLIAVGDSSTEVYKAAQAAGVKSPILWYVPDPNVSYFFPIGISI